MASKYNNIKCPECGAAEKTFGVKAQDPETGKEDRIRFGCMNKGCFFQAYLDLETFEVIEELSKDRR